MTEQAIVIFHRSRTAEAEIYGPFPSGDIATRWASKAFDGLPSTVWFWLPQDDPEAAEFAHLRVRHANLDII